jgi:hypothetical protein
MNGVPHSEHVISRSGIAVSPREWIFEDPTLCSSERWRRVSFHHKFVGRKRCFSQTLRRKAGVPTGLVGLSVLQQLSLFKFLFDLHKKKCGKTSSQVITNVDLAPHADGERPVFRTAHRLLE